MGLASAEANPHNRTAVNFKPQNMMTQRGAKKLRVRFAIRELAQPA